MKNTTDMTKGAPLPLLLRFGTPLMLTSLLRQLYTLCDSLIIGRLLGLEAFAAIGAAGFVAGLPQSMFLGLSLGYEAVLAQLFGSGDAAGFRAARRRTALLSFFGAFAASMILIVLREPLLELLNTPAELMSLSGDYLLVIYSGLSIHALFDWASSVLRASGDSRTPLNATFLSSLCNVAIDLLLIYGIPLGVKGAALGTVAAHLISLLICLKAMGKGRLQFPEAAPHRVDGSVKRLLQMGLPPMLRDGVIAIGGLFVQSVVNSFGVALVAGMSASGVYFSVMNMAGDGIEGAVATFVGQNAGAGLRSRIRHGVGTAAGLAIALSASTAALVWILAPYLIALITGYGDPDALRMGTYALRCSALFLPFLYLLCMYRAALQSMGDSVTPLLSGFTELGMRIFCVLVLPPYLGFTAACIAEGCGWLGAAALLAGTYLTKMHREETPKLTSR